MELTNTKTLALLHLPNCIQHSHLPSAEGFLPLKICLIPLNLKRVVYCFTMGVQKLENRADLPQFQNVVGILILTTVLSLNFQASQNREKKVFIYRPTRSRYNLMFQCTKCQHWFHPECQDIKLKACQLKHSRIVGWMF